MVPKHFNIGELLIKYKHFGGFEKKKMYQK